jgi:hypothetical protein
MNREEVLELLKEVGLLRNCCICGTLMTSKKPICDEWRTAMMNDTAIININRVVEEEIKNGNAVIGVISLAKNGDLVVSWRTDNPEVSSAWLHKLTRCVKFNQITREVLPLPKLT